MCCGASDTRVERGDGAHLDECNVILRAVGTANASAVTVVVACCSILTILLTSSQSLRDLV